VEWVLAAAILGGASIFAAAIWSRARSASGAVVRPSEALTAAPPAIAELLERTAAVEVEQRSIRTAFAAFLEEADEVLAAVERKRRQTASSAARAARDQGAETPDGVEALQAPVVDREAAKAQIMSIWRARGGRR
jgi:hypothetical protein